MRVVFLVTVLAVLGVNCQRFLNTMDGGVPGCNRRTCARQPCPGGAQPVVYPGQCCPICPPSGGKPGRCPPRRGTVGLCLHVYECTGDFSCPGSKKCCSTGCGRQCMRPVIVGQY
ncbi:perlwapin-like [Mya arenaria]|uniref:perlwapin-like n=1 Tax=Mya arenaria TaxID=6604 RepID=UPI0022E469BB|nr:perlwapin-like [Mya arenaria]